MESIQYAEVRALARPAGGAGRVHAFKCRTCCVVSQRYLGPCFRQRIWTDTHSKALGRGAAFYQNCCRVQSSSLTVVRCSSAASGAVVHERRHAS